jgi:hypothetical protein
MIWYQIKLIMLEIKLAKRVNNAEERKNTRLSTTVWYRVLSGDSFESPIFSLQLLVALAINGRPA